jgi:hypothetical protein
VQKSLAERYHVIVPQASQTVHTIPTDVFLNFNRDEDEIMRQQDMILSGNLSKYW